MNWQQKSYTLKRIEQIAFDKVNDAKIKYTVNGVSLKNTEKWDLIKSGKVVMKPKAVVASRYHDNLDDFFDFSKYEFRTYVQEEFETVHEKIMKLARNAKDTVVLGDCEEALKIIKELEETKI